MAYEIPGFKVGTLATNTTTFATKQYTCVTQSSSAGIIRTPSDGAAMIGVMQNQPTISGEEVEITSEGITKVKFLSTGFSLNSNYVVGTSGRIDTTGNAGAGYVIYGPVLELATTAGGIGTVLLKTVGVTT
jgi:hypothetical protein